MRLVLITVFGLALSGCALQTPIPFSDSGGVVTIRGTITEDTAAAFQESLKAGVSRVRIVSGGGQVGAALAIAREIRDRRIDVEVIGECFSSCANYIFPAGATRTISGNGVVAWHGNVHHMLHQHETGQKLIRGEDLPLVWQLVDLEKQFFASIGVDQRVCWFGKLEPYLVRNLYFLVAEDMARFGIANVNVRPDYAETDVSGYNSGGVENLRLIRAEAFFAESAGQ